MARDWSTVGEVVRVNNAHPAAPYLRAAIVPAMGQLSIDPVSGRKVGTWQYSGQYVHTVLENGGRFSYGEASSCGLALTSVTGFATDGEMTLVVWGVGSTAAGTLCRFADNNGGGYTPASITINGSSQYAATVRLDGVVQTYGAGTDTAIVAGRVDCVAMRHRSGAQDLWLNGRKAAATGSYTGTFAYAPNMPGHSDDGARRVGILLAFNRFLPDSLLVDVFNSPGKLLQSGPPRRVWVQLGAAETGDAAVSVTGVAATTALGTPTVTTSGSVTVNATGVSATTALGTTTQTYTASVAQTGVAATGQLGTTTQSGTANVTATGVAATSQLGTTTQTYSGSVAETGLVTTGQLGTTTQTYSGSVAQTGVSTASALGTVSVTTTAGVTVSPTGVAATGQLGTTTQIYTASVAATGVATTGQLGTVSVTTTASVTVNATGVSVTGQLGTVSVTTTASVSVDATGVAATTAVGTVSASGVSPQVAAPVSDVAAGGWQSTGATLYEVLDETTQNDSDYIYSPNNPTTEQFEIMFSALVDPASSAGHIIRLGLQAVGQDTTFTFKLVQGTTVLDTWDETVTAGTTATRSRTFAGAVADNITNYTDLRLRGVAHA
jgi:hypothetical protein